MKNIDLIRLNLHCNRLTNIEAITFWKDERNDYEYKNFTKDTYTYIEKNIPEIIFLLLKNTKNFIFYYIKKELEIEIYITNDIQDFIYLENYATYKVSYFFKIINHNDELHSDYIRVTNIIELQPSSWIAKSIIELLNINTLSKTLSLIHSINRINKVYDDDLILINEQGAKNTDMINENNYSLDESIHSTKKKQQFLSKLIPTDIYINKNKWLWSTQNNIKSTNTKKFENNNIDEKITLKEYLDENEPKQKVFKKIRRKSSIQLDFIINSDNSYSS